MLLGDGVPRQRAVTVHEGIDLGRIAAASPAKLHEELWLPHGSPIIGNVAALVPHKGQKHLVEAAALVVRQVPDARFIIAGEGELRPSLEHQIKHLGLEKHVLLAGFRPDVLSVHKAFDMFVMSSVTEGLGTSILDAMACGRPVVATTAGGIPEVVRDGETGILVPPRDHEAMADAIVKLLKDEPLRRRMGAAGLSLANARFSAGAHGAGDAQRLPTGRAASPCVDMRSRASVARPADPAKRALRVPLLPPIAAGVHHPYMADGEVEANGISRIQLPAAKR